MKRGTWRESEKQRRVSFGIAASGHIPERCRKAPPCRLGLSTGGRSCHVRATNSRKVEWSGVDGTSRGRPSDLGRYGFMLVQRLSRTSLTRKRSEVQSPIAHHKTAGETGERSRGRTDWSPDDRSAAALAPGRCFRVSIVLRADAVWQYADGRRWKCILLESKASATSPHRRALAQLRGDQVEELGSRS
jgi:hypothetical protein